MPPFLPVFFLGGFGFADGTDALLLPTDQDLFHVGPFAAAVGDREVDGEGDKVVSVGIPVLAQQIVLRVRETEEFFLDFDDDGIDRNFSEGSFYARARIFFVVIFRDTSIE